MEQGETFGLWCWHHGSWAANGLPFHDAQRLQCQGKCPFAIVVETPGIVATMGEPPLRECQEEAHDGA